MHRIYLVILFVLASLIVSSCSNIQKEEEFSQFENPITAHNLDYGSNVLFMEDFVSDAEQIDSVLISGIKMGFYQTKKQIAFQAADFQEPLLVMQIWVKGKSKDVLLKKSRKQKFMYSFNPYNQQFDSIQLAGEFNGWTPSVTKLEWHDTSWQQALFLEPGKYAYQLVVNNQWKLDPANHLTMPNGQGGENSVLEIGKDNSDKQPRLESYSFSTDSLSIAMHNEPIQVYVFWNNQFLNYSVDQICNGLFTMEIPSESKSFALSYLRVYAYNDFGLSNDLLIPLVNGKVATSINDLPRNAWHTNVMYNVFVDRFYDGNSDNNKPLPDSIVLPAANYNGGDIQGIIQKIREGYFDELGANALWISPVVKNTEGAYGFWPNPKTKFSAYHGYWPTSFTQINPHFGNAADLKELVNLAHELEKNVFLDIVANHVHQEHPYYKTHPECATELNLPDGTLNLERWDDHRLTTWFDKFLPTLDLERPEVAQMLADSSVWWAQEYQLDGFRYDAAKHVPLSFWRTLTRELKDSIILKNNQSIYQLGETYGSSELIGSYISSGLLDAQFDFNVYDAALSSFAGGNDMSLLAERLKESINVYGAHNLMVYITGNQDRARFISYAGGALKFNEDAKAAGWTRDIEIGDSLAFKKLQMLMAFNMTIPGIPVIYYGDEFGMPGGNDPDSRRMMRFGDQLSAIEKANLEVTKKLIKIRKSNMALLYGDIDDLESNQKSLSYTRRYFNQFAWVAFNNSEQPIRFNIPIPKDIKSTNLRTNFGNNIEINDMLIEIEIPANSFEIIIIN